SPPQKPLGCNRTTGGPFPPQSSARMVIPPWPGRSRIWGDGGRAACDMAGAIVVAPSGDVRQRVGDRLPAGGVLGGLGPGDGAEVVDDPGGEARVAVREGVGDGGPGGVGDEVPKDVVGD